MIEGVAGLRIAKECRILRKAMGGAYCYRRLQIAGKDLYRDAPEKNAYSHVSDALQYLLLGAGEGQSLIRPRDARWAQPNTKWVV